MADRPYVIALNEHGDDERALVGGKARHLARLRAEGFPVPTAAVLTTAAYRDLVSRPSVAHSRRALRSAVEDGESDDRLESLFDSLVEAMLAEEFPPELSQALREAFEQLTAEDGALAVRSSGTLEDAAEASFSGMLVSVIGVRTLEELVLAVKRCWASASNPRVLGYEGKRGIDGDALEVAVILQRLVRAERAGLAFTRDPVNRYASGIVVESTQGPGEDIVSGEVTPQRYVYYPKDERVVFVRTLQGVPGATAIPEESQRHLSDSDVAELACWGMRAEEVFGTPQDLEWAFGDGRFWILQSRPLVFSAREEQVFFPQVAEETVLLHGVGASPRVGSGQVLVAIDDVPQRAAGSVVVLRRLTNDLAVRLRDAAGVVADEGGATSHGANLLREFGVPAVISTGHATERLSDGATVTVDGFRGVVYEGDLSVGPEAFEGVPKTRIKVFASVLVPEKAEIVAPFADGVSSLRDDYFLLRSGIHPLEMIARGQADELEETVYRGVSRTAEIFAGKPVWFKTMDAPSDEFRRLAGGEQEPEERNPLLGWRGIGRELAEPEMLDVELRAVARAVADGHQGLGIKLPFVRFVSEFEQVLGAMRRLGLRPGEDVEVGISVETPAVALRLTDFLTAGAAFVSVGASDLTMCTLAVDRESRHVADRFNPAHPAVVELLDRIAETARAAGVFACVTGESARHERLLPHLVRTYDAIGVSLAYFAEVKKRICDTEGDSARA